MPSCCAVGCTSRKTKEKDLVFYRIPKKNQIRRESWLRAIKRTSEWSKDKLEHARLCSIHFISG